VVGPVAGDHGLAVGLHARGGAVAVVVVPQQPRVVGVDAEVVVRRARPVAAVVGAEADAAGAGDGVAGGVGEGEVVPHAAGLGRAVVADGADGHVVGMGVGDVLDGDLHEVFGRAVGAARDGHGAHRRGAAVVEPPDLERATHLAHRVEVLGAVLEGAGEVAGAEDEAVPVVAAAGVAEQGLGGDVAPGAAVDVVGDAVGGDGRWAAGDAPLLVLRVAVVPALHPRLGEGHEAGRLGALGAVEAVVVEQGGGVAPGGGQPHLIVAHLVAETVAGEDQAIEVVGVRQREVNELHVGRPRERFGGEVLRVDPDAHPVVAGRGGLGVHLELSSVSTCIWCPWLPGAGSAS